MNIVVLGRGKTGSLVAEVARERGHSITVMAGADNQQGGALTSGKLAAVDVVIDFTVPGAVLANIEACIRAGKKIVVGTTGWYAEIPRIRAMVEEAGTALLYAANFSVGVNLFFDVARTAAI